MSWCLCLYDWEGGILQGQRNGLRAGYASLKCSHHHEGVVRMRTRIWTRKKYYSPWFWLPTIFLISVARFLHMAQTERLPLPLDFSGTTGDTEVLSWTNKFISSNHGSCCSRTCDEHLLSNILGEELFSLVVDSFNHPKKHLSKTCLESGQGNVCVSPDPLTG